jgi:hypothetical protein
MQLTLCLLTVVLAAPGPTTDFETGVTCSEVRLATQTRAEWLAFRPAALLLVPPDRDPSWILTDSLFASGEFAAGKRLALSFDRSNDTLELFSAIDTLPALCRQSLDYAPNWLREDLSNVFRRLGDSSEFYAQLLLNTQPPYVDEVAFCIAHIGPEVLTHRAFNPDLLGRNARYLYQISDSLEYAEIVDHGTLPGDYYSTVRYAVLSGQDTVWVELPREIYYHYVVHPTTSDEIPRLDAYVYNKHWREYLFYEADSGHPVLQDYIKQARVVWSRTRQVLPAGRPFDPNACALDVIGNWATRTVPSGASGNRPIHPNVIAHEHNGNCGELQDLMTAASRTCLIPAINTSDPCEDHVWSEFWDDGWYPYQVDLGFGVTHIADTSVAYDERHGGSKRVSSIWNWRPDGYWWTVTRKYSNVCSLYVRVLDARGLPLDGARVLLYSEGWYGGLSVTTVSYADAVGAAAFELGDLRNFYVQVATPLGTWPSATGSVKVINVSQTGAVYFTTLCMPFAVGAPRPHPVLFNGDSAVTHKLELDLSLPYGFNTGYAVQRGAGAGDPDDSIRFYQYYADKHPAGITDLFVTDTSGYAGYLGGRRFDALLVADDVPGQQLEFVYPTADRYNLVLSAEDKVGYSSWLQLGARLYRRGVGIAGPGTDGLPVIACPAIARGRLSLGAGNLTGPWSVRVFDASGRLVAAPEVAGNGFRYSAQFPAGVYVVKLENQAGAITRKTVVVR